MDEDRIGERKSSKSRAQRRWVDGGGQEEDVASTNVGKEKLNCPAFPALSAQSRSTNHSPLSSLGNTHVLHVRRPHNSCHRRCST